MSDYKVIWLSLAFLIMQLIGVFLAYYLFDDGKDAARTAFLICAVVDGALLIFGATVSVYHIANKNMAAAIREHDRVDAEGDADKLAVLLNGAAAVTGAQNQGRRADVAADANALKWTQLTLREAQRMADERNKQPAADDDFLRQLLGADEPMLLGKDNDL